MPAKNAKEIRISNLTNLYRAVLKSAPVTRKALADKVNLSLMTVSTLVDQLIGLGLITTSPVKDNNKSGRKADLLSPNVDDKRILVVDLTKYSYTYDVLDLQLESIIDSEYYDYDASLSYLSNLTKFYEQMRSRLESDGYFGKLTGVVVVAPGPFLSDKELVINKRIPELSHIKIKDFTQSYFPDIITFVDEDVKFTAYSLLEHFADLDGKIAVYIYISEGVGGAMIHDLKIITGKTGIAGDVGQMMVSNNQNYEDVLSIHSLYRELTGVDTNNVNYSGTISRLLMEKERNKEKFNSCLLEVHKNLTMLLYSITWLVNPDIVFIDCDYLCEIDPEYQTKITEMLNEKFLEHEYHVPEFVSLENNLKGSSRGGGLKALELFIKNAANNS